MLNSVAEKYVQRLTGVLPEEVTPEVYANYISTKKRIYTPIKYLMQKFNLLMDKHNEPTRSSIRKCPHCGTAWCNP